MAKLLFLSLVFLLHHVTAAPQEISGLTVNENGQAAYPVAVIVLDKEYRHVSFCNNTSEGRFALSMTSHAEDAAYLLFSGMGYERDTISLKEWRNGGTITLKSKETRLKEVVVESRRIRQHGDTIDYGVARFRKEQDRSLADVIKRMPGLEVKDDGTIEYQGEKISRLYIEGMDMLGKSYSLASENIPVKSVKTVQVLEHHQHIKMLKGMDFSQQAALNIILTDEAKSQWHGSADAGMGHSVQGSGEWLGDTRLLGMAFTKKMQSLTIHKFNNTGKSIEREVSGDTSDQEAHPGEPRHYLRDTWHHGLMTDESRHRMNTSHLAATNWLLKTGKGNDLRVQVSGLFDKTRLREESTTDYTAVEGDNRLAERHDVKRNRNEMAGRVTYTVNKDNLYLTNELATHNHNNHSGGFSAYNGNAAKAMVRPHIFSIGDELRLTRQMASQTQMGLSASIFHCRLPGELLTTDSTSQECRYRSTDYQVSISYRRKAGNFRLKADLGMRGQHLMNETRNEINTFEETFTEEEMSLTPKVEYIGERLKAGLQLGIAHISQKYETDSYRHLMLRPTLTITCELSPKWSANAMYSYSEIPLDYRQISRYATYTSAKSVTQGLGESSLSRNHSIGSSIYYKNTVRGLFGNIHLLVNTLSGVPLSESYLIGDEYRSRLVNITSDTGNMMVWGRISKSVRWLGSTAGLSASYNRNAYDLLIGGVMKPFETEMGNAGVDFSAQCLGWLSIEGKSRWNFSKQTNKSMPEAGSGLINHFSHSLSIYVFYQGYQLCWTSEYHHGSGKYIKNNYFGDLSVSKTVRGIEIGICLNNMFGRDRYERRDVSDATITHTAIPLRPRELMAKVHYNF